MNAPTALRHILIDFENLPMTDLAPVAGLPVEVTLLVGERNKRLEITLVAQLLAGGSRVHLIQVGASGRNALDLTLAYYLGRATAENPRAEFFIVSKDADYDPMIAHANRNGMIVSRHPSVEELPFLEPEKGQPDISEEQLQAYAQKLRRAAPPRDLSALRKKIQNDLKKYIGPDGVDAVIAWLEKDGTITVGADGRVQLR